MGSVIAVDCIYRKLGFKAKVLTASHAVTLPARSDCPFPANAPRTRRNNPTHASTYDTIEGIDPPAPLRHAAIDAINGAISRCGSGSHTVPSCRSPGVRE